MSRLILLFYSRQLNSFQVNYTASASKLLLIVETLKDFKNVLLGQQNKACKDHKLKEFYNEYSFLEDIVRNILLSAEITKLRSRNIKKNKLYSVTTSHYATLKKHI